MAMFRSFQKHSVGGVRKDVGTLDFLGNWFTTRMKDLVVCELNVALRPAYCSLLLWL